MVYFDILFFQGIIYNDLDFRLNCFLGCDSLKTADCLKTGSSMTNSFVTLGLRLFCKLGLLRMSQVLMAFWIWPYCIYVQTKRILSLDIGLLIAGAKERGELEARVTELLKEIKESGKNISGFLSKKNMGKVNPLC